MVSPNNKDDGALTKVVGAFLMVLVAIVALAVVFDHKRQQMHYIGSKYERAHDH